MELRNKVIHCRVTPTEQEKIARAARDAGTSITKFVIRAALAQTQEPAD